MLKRAKYSLGLSTSNDPHNGEHAHDLQSSDHAREHHGPVTLVARGKVRMSLGCIFPRALGKASSLLRFKDWANTSSRFRPRMRAHFRWRLSMSGDVWLP